MTTVDQRSGSCSPVSGAFKPVEDVGAPGVVDLVKRMSIGLLNSHCVTKRGKDQGEISIRRKIRIQFFCILIRF